MTPSEALAQARTLLLDFDGPICAVFAGIPGSFIADQLRQILADDSRTKLPEAVATSTDPFDVLNYASMLGADEARYVEAAFTAHEVNAITTATPTKGAHELIRTWHASGRKIAIVSNNSTLAIDAYLNFYKLHTSIDFVSARTTADTTFLKPSPHLIYQAISALSAAPEDCVFIGDSTTDIDASSAAGIMSIGYANKLGKSETLAAAEVVIESMVDLIATP
ncbi:MAG TPA: HAD-IA family hydrolase [Nonomuraea sp.]|nr:HAD-IA family hydrolase [Nonomuraea sp.]